MTGAPERIWIDGGDDCPYFYHESELADAGGPVVEYIRADLVPQWQPIETAPRDGRLIVAVVNEEYTTGHVEIFAVVFFKDGRWISECPEPGGYYSPTRWMPLPEPPQ